MPFAEDPDCKTYLICLTCGLSTDHWHVAWNDTCEGAYCERCCPLCLPPADREGRTTCGCLATRPKE